MTGLIEGKIAIVTGGAKGLGKGIARRFAREGASVIVVGRDGGAAHAMAETLTADFGHPALGFAVDMSVQADVEAMVARTVERFGRVDILINNAATLSPNILLEHKTDAMLQQVLGVALWGSWWAMRAAFPHMRAQGGGAIVNFYSIDAEVGAWLHADYNIAKSALIGLTRSAAVEWGRFGIRVNAVAPTGVGVVFEKLMEAMPTFREDMAAFNPLLKVGDPEEDIAPAVLFLASDMARFVTGEMLHVDGGQNLPGYNSKPNNLAELEVAK